MSLIPVSLLGVREGEFHQITNLGCGQSLATNALKHLMDQRRKNFTNQLKNASKRLQHRVDHTLKLL